MPTIFISYRWSDTQAVAERLRGELARRFGAGSVFRDQENIPSGTDWREYIDAKLDEGTIVLALIGSTWVTNRDEHGTRLIDDPANHNRQELETALQRGRLIIPVLVDEARMPSRETLPESLHGFAGLNARKLRWDAWTGDVERLVAELEGKGFAEAAGRHGAADGGGAARIHRRAYAWAAGLALAVAAAGGAWWYARDASSAEVPRPSPDARVAPAPMAEGPYFSIVFDRSARMAERFESGTKLDVARDAVLAALQTMSSNDNIAWREFGGDCRAKGPENDRSVLPFVPGTERISARVKAIASASGASTLTRAVTEATGEFNQVPRSDHRTATLIVITAGFDECTPNASDGGAEIRERLKRYAHLEFDLRVVGLALTPESQTRVEAFAKAAGGRLTNVLTANQLSTEVVQALVIGPKLRDVRAVVLTLDGVSKNLNAAIGNITKETPDLSAAERALENAASAFTGSQLPERNTNQPPAILRLIDLAEQSRGEQRKMLDAVGEMIARSRAGDAEGLRAATRAYNSASNTNNAHLRDISTLQNQLASGQPASTPR